MLCRMMIFEFWFINQRILKNSALSERVEENRLKLTQAFSPPNYSLSYIHTFCLFLLFTRSIFLIYTHILSLPYFSLLLSLNVTHTHIHDIHIYLPLYLCSHAHKTRNKNRLVTVVTVVAKNSSRKLEGEVLEVQFQINGM